jgi:hypothetical protein
MPPRALFIKPSVRTAPAKPTPGQGPIVKPPMARPVISTQVPQIDEDEASLRERGFIENPCVNSAQSYLNILVEYFNQDLLDDDTFIEGVISVCQWAGQDGCMLINPLTQRHFNPTIMSLARNVILQQFSGAGRIIDNRVMDARIAETRDALSSAIISAFETKSKPDPSNMVRGTVHGSSAWSAFAVFGIVSTLGMIVLYYFTRLFPAQ